jgi:pentatricopeptide repeat protein
MLNNGYKPLDSAHSFVTLGLCKIKRYEEARYFNDLVNERCRSRPAVESLDMIEVQNYKAGVGHLLCAMHLKGYSVMTGAPIAQQSAVKCSIKNLSQIVSEKEKAQISASYTSLVKTLCDDRRVDYAYQLYREMLENGFPPNLEAYKLMISRANKMGDVYKAMELFLEMRKNGLEGESSMYDEIVNGLCKRGRADTNIKQYMPFLSQLQDEGKTTDVATVWDMILSKGIFAWIGGV